MQLLIKNATILRPTEDSPQKGVDLLIQDGIIQKIGTNLIAPGVQEVTSDDLHVSMGWMDLGTQIGDPGLEHREDLTSAANAAMAGGFTALACLPNTQPAIDTKAQVLYIQNNTRHALVDFYPIGAASKNCEGKDLTEMLDLYKAGAVAFSDGKKAIQNNGMMMRALQYAKAFNGLVLNQPHDHSICQDGQVHEGEVSTSLGIKGIPDLAEIVMVERDINLLEYTASKAHLTNISSAKSVGLVRAAKQKQLQITASVPVLNLIFEDKEVLEFDANYKVMPPLRAQTDREALIAGLIDGTIDIISTNHVPLEEEEKKLEFAYAGFGVIGLETAFALLNTHLAERLGLERIIEKLAFNPRTILGLDLPLIQEGEQANLTIFDPSLKWNFEMKDIFSKSKNTPCIGHVFLGRVLGVVNNHQSSFLALQ